MKTYLSYHPKLKIDLGGISSENSIRKKLVKPANKSAKLVTKTNSKVRKFKTYDKVINDPIYENKWCKVINKEL